MSEFINPVIKPDIFIPDEREPVYRQLESLHHQLHVPMPQLFVETELFDKYGNVISHEQRRAHSWNRNAYNVALCNFAAKDADDATTFAGGYLNIKDTGGTVRNGNNMPTVGSGSVDSAGNGYLAASAVSTFGILVGDDDTAVTFEDYFLGSQVAHGEGAGQLSYSAMQTHDESYVGGSLTYTITHARYFNNNESGEGAISVEEVCLVANGYLINNYKFLVSHDLTGTKSIPYQGALKVSYAISLVYSA